jgi:hypothetical protein
MMNAENNGLCHTNGETGGLREIGNDEEGNSLITGDGKGSKDGHKRFTLQSMETWQIFY